MATSGAKKVSRAEIHLWRLVLLVAFLALWEVATRRGWIDPFFVSQPTVLAAQIVDWIRSGFIFRHLWVTMQETIIGFLLGTLLGVAVGFLFARWQTLAHDLRPAHGGAQRHAARRAGAALHPLVRPRADCPRW